jgi:putative endonuclease
MSNNLNIGKKGEKIAENYLKRKNLILLERNFKFMRCEIDLIFRDKKSDLLIFVEVKTRNNKKFGEPEESITYFKQNNIKKSAQGFLLKNKKFENFDLRFDTISILYDEKNEYVINHIECAF